MPESDRPARTNNRALSPHPRSAVGAWPGQGAMEAALASSTPSCDVRPRRLASPPLRAGAGTAILLTRCLTCVGKNASAASSYAGRRERGPFLPPRGEARRGSKRCRRPLAHEDFECAENCASQPLYTLQHRERICGGSSPKAHAAPDQPAVSQHQTTSSSNLLPTTRT
ncbi:hypothetical protein K458DRAFT_47571 [Lentithecium fluviatile CBS 122367]|uniref:Uncharacterized protein n=1 Tax=Lentithecium fluviatile CBS 122367 TaxID=1168545 RepID=A0A6G1IZ45_9PLEO|nr:hypothetical protein K458DRAFT_47571 [Lentithecium fluviatile CBS 122367]